MLSFIKRKLSESDSATNSNTDGHLVRKISQMSLGSGVVDSEEAIAIGEDALLQELGYRNANDLQETVYGKLMINCISLKDTYISFVMISDCLKTIRDPEKPATLEDLSVIYENGIFIMPPTKSNVSVVSHGYTFDICMYVHCKIKSSHNDFLLLC